LENHLEKLSYHYYAGKIRFQTCSSLLVTIPLS